MGELGPEESRLTGARDRKHPHPSICLSHDGVMDLAGGAHAGLGGAFDGAV